MFKTSPFTAKSLMTAGAIATLLANPAMAQDKVVKTKSSVISTQTSTMATPVVLPADKPDTEMQQLLSVFASLKPKPIESLSVDNARKQPTLADAVMKMAEIKKIGKPDNSMIEKDYASFRSDVGNEVPLDIYYTKVEGDMTKSRPVILYLHGGGWVIGSNKAYEASIIALAKKTNAVVVSPNYNQSPEVLYPGAHDEAFETYKWILKHAEKNDWDAKRVAVVGESAGGNMAANVGITARDTKTQLPVALGLIYPVAGTDMSTPSYVQNANAKPLNKAMMNWFITKMTKPETKDAVMTDVRLNVSKANLNGLPKTTVITAGIDPLRSEGETLANSLKLAGVPVIYQNYRGVTHEFFGADLVLTKARAAQDLLSNELNMAFMSHGKQ